MTYRKPKRFFEDSGTVNPEESYYVPLENVTNRKKQDIKQMIDKGRYFSIFAPRQSGKTTFFEETCRVLHTDSTYVAVVLSFEQYSELNKETFYSLIEKALYSQLIDRLNAVNCQKIEAIQQFLESHRVRDHISFSHLFEELNRMIQFKKIVIFIDEFDGVPLDELSHFLTSLRSLYQKYKKIKTKALYSIGLVGIRNITKLAIGGVSPFNIADQVTLPGFSHENVRRLYGQYSDETNQPFTDSAIKRIHNETSGQPWLVNRLGSILTLDVKPGTIEPIDEEDVEKAIRLLLKESNDHFDNLYEKAKRYKETFVEIVFDHVEYDSDDRDQSWLEQYGLIKDDDDHAVVGNNIYKLRYLKTFFKEANAYDDLSIGEYALSENKLDMKRIIFNFGRYIAKIGVKAFYAEKKPYDKTGQFLLTAWLYQFVKGGQSDLDYEVLTGLGRMDIILTYKGKKYIIETKVNRHSDVKGIIKEGVLQLSNKYMEPEGTGEGYLVVFDTVTAVGAKTESKLYPVENKQVLCFTIPIGEPD